MRSLSIVERMIGDRRAVCRLRRSMRAIWVGSRLRRCESLRSALAKRQGLAQ